MKEFSPRRLRFFRLILFLLPPLVVVAVLGGLELYFTGKGAAGTREELEPGFEHFDARVGNLPVAGRRSRARAFTADGRLLYDVHYSIDPQSRRLTQNLHSGPCSEALLVMGCSFVFGEGLEDAETLPSQLGVAAPELCSYNYGFRAWGPGNLLQRVRMPGFAAEFPEQQGRAVYVFIDHHLARLVGNLSLSRLNPIWRWVLPDFRLDSQGRLEFRGIMARSRPLESRIHRLLGASGLLRHFTVDFPARFGEQDYRLFTSVVTELKAELARRKGIREFTLVFYPGSQLAPVLIPYLQGAGIRVLDYSRLDLGKLVESPAIPGEGVHPSAAANRVLAERLARDLGLNKRH
jgi:hypothetical protein